MIVAENKMDLFRPSTASHTPSADGEAPTTVAKDEHALARKRQQIVALMQRFPFVRQCIKCSAKQLLRVDDVFLKAQQAVLYPFVPPLYDLKTGQLTIECKRALTRIFRMFDRDNDGLLADAELYQFQRETFSVTVFDKDLSAWKKVVTRNNPFESEESVLQDGKFTVQGFLTIFDVFISQNRLDVVWQALRKFNYDDDLNLEIPDSISIFGEDMTTGSFTSAPWRLSHSSKQFLTKMFIQFDSDKDGFVSPDDLIAMFSILPPPALPPWHPMRAPELFESCFSLPKESPTSGSSSGSDSPDFGGDAMLIVPSTASMTLQQSILSTSGVSILSASDSLPSVDVGGMHPLSKSLSFLEWMGHWHTVSAISPSVTRAELYKLGHTEDYNRKTRHPPHSFRRRSNTHGSTMKAIVIGDVNSGNTVYYDSTLKSCEVRVLVLGSRGCGKTALLNALCCAVDGTIDGSAQSVDTPRTSRPQTSSTFIKLKRGVGSTVSKDKIDKIVGNEFVVHLVFSDVPETAATRQKEHYKQLSELFGATTTATERVCDLAMMVYDSRDASSFAVVRDLESKLLDKETPRVFVATKGDLISLPDTDASISSPESAHSRASAHCQEFDLEQPLLTSALEMSLEVGSDDRTNALIHLVRCSLTNDADIEPLKSKPHEAEKRREANRRRKMMWIGGIVSVGVVVVVGVGLLLSGSTKKDKKGSFCWLRSLFNGATLFGKDQPKRT